MIRRGWTIPALCALLLSGLVAADRFDPPGGPRPAAVTPLEPGGVLACPFLSHGNGRSWIHLANAGAQSAKITVTVVRTPARPVVTTLSLPAGRTRTLPLDTAIREASGAIVEYAGGAVFASRTSIFETASDRRGGVAAACGRAGEPTLVVPNGSTLGADSFVVLLNPATSDAVADLTLLEDGDEVDPEGLKSVVVPARGRKAVRVADFAFDQRSIATVIRVRTGVLAADGIIASARGITLTPAQPAAPLLAGVAVTGAGQGLLDAVAFGEQDSVVDAALLTKDGRGAFGALAQEVGALAPQTVALGPERLAAVGVRLEVLDGPPLAAALRFVVQTSSGSGDVAGSEMTPPRRRLVAVAGHPATGEHSRVLIANPNEAPATVDITLLGERDAPATLASTTIEAGRVVSLPIGVAAGSFAVLVEASLPVAMTLASTVFGTKDVTSDAVTGRPLERPRAVEVRTDPRLGVPAPGFA